MKLSNIYPYLFCACLFAFIACNPQEPTDISDAIPSNYINKIIIDKQGVKWFATNKGLVSFDGKNWKVYSNISTLFGKPISDLTFDNAVDANNILVGTNEGVTKATFAQQNLTLKNNYHFAANKLLNDTVLKLAFRDNLNFFGTQKGLSILKNDTTWTTYDGQWGRRTDNFLTLFPITGIATAKNGWNYVSTKGGGVSRFKYTDAVSGATKYFQPWAYGLKTDTVFTVVIVNDTCQWYGTTKGAAFHTSESTKADWTSYSTENGLASDSVYAIAQDLLGNTWFGTQRGVSKLSNQVFTNYSTKDGLAGNKVNTIAVDTDGSVWFGTETGISHLKDGKWKSYSVK